MVNCSVLRNPAILRAQSVLFVVSVLSLHIRQQLLPGVPQYFYLPIQAQVL